VFGRGLRVLGSGAPSEFDSIAVICARRHGDAAEPCSRFTTGWAQRLTGRIQKAPCPRACLRNPQCHASCCATSWDMRTRATCRLRRSCHRAAEHSCRAGGEPCDGGVVREINTFEFINKDGGSPTFGSWGHLLACGSGHILERRNEDLAHSKGWKGRRCLRMAGQLHARKRSRGAAKWQDVHFPLGGNCAESASGRR